MEMERIGKSATKEYRGGWGRERKEMMEGG